MIGIEANRKLPRGVYVLALLLFLGGGIMLLAAIVLPIQGTNLVPWYIYLAYAAYLMAVGWGLWGARRWAYLAALLMCVVLGLLSAPDRRGASEKRAVPVSGLGNDVWLFDSAQAAGDISPAHDRRMTSDG